MAKKSAIERNNKRRKLKDRFAAKRAADGGAFRRSA